MTAHSTRTTGNDPVEGANPGGTHSTRPGKKTPGGDERATAQEVESGDRNPRRESRTPGPRDPES